MTVEVYAVGLPRKELFCFSRKCVCTDLPFSLRQMAITACAYEIFDIGIHVGPVKFLAQRVGYSSVAHVEQELVLLLN